MRLHHVPARTGLLWVRLGLRTFARQPLAMGGLFFMFILTVSVLAMVPLIGAPLALALLPAATLGLMAAAKEADRGQFPMPTVLATAFRAGRERARAMLLLGALYALGSLIVMALAGWLSGTPSLTLEGDGPPKLDDAALLRNLAWQGVLYVPLGLLFWHAPALVHWHGVHPIKSLFFSGVACWTNKGALLVFMLGWSAVFFAVSLVLVLLAQLLGGPGVLQVLMFPVAALLSAAFFTSLYFTFRDSFLTDDGLPPA